MVFALFSLDFYQFRYSILLKKSKQKVVIMVSKRIIFPIVLCCQKSWILHLNVRNYISTNTLVIILPLIMDSTEFVSLANCSCVCLFILNLLMMIVVTVLLQNKDIYYLK